MHDLPALLGSHRTASEPALARAASARSVERWVASGRLVRVHPGWVTLPGWADDWIVRARAATGYTGGMLSHTSALTLHGVIDEEFTRLDVTVPAGHRLRSTRWLAIHRSTRPHGVVTARGLPATPLPRSLIDAWAEAHGGQRKRGDVDLARNALFRACREGQAGGPSIESEMAMVPRLPGLQELPATGVLWSAGRSRVPGAVPRRPWHRQSGRGNGGTKDSVNVGCRQREPGPPAIRSRRAIRSAIGGCEANIDAIP